MTAKRGTKKPPRNKSIVDPVTMYANAVVAGKIIAGRPVRLACERHLRDLKEQKKRGLVWKSDKAQLALDFFPEMLVLEDGQPFTLVPWQTFVVGSCFGWYKSDGFRRFRTAYVETGKGSGKTPLAAGIGLYGMVADGEKAAEVYSAATERDQAKIVWKDAHRMVRDSPELAELIDHPDNPEVQIASMSIPKDSSVFKPVSAEHRGLDGKRVHIALIDELHEHRSSIVVDKMRAGTKRRQNALIFEITNSGYDRTSVCYAHHELSIQVLEGTADNEAWFAYVCALDEADDWLDESVWPKANPSLGTVLPLAYLREQVRDAVTMPSKENIVKRLNFCMWTEQSERWLPLDAWDACGKPIGHHSPGGLSALSRSLMGLRCFVGLDMASRRDLTAAAFLFPDGSGGYDVMMRFWIPKHTLTVEGAREIERSESDRLMLQRWTDAGLIKATDGNVTDYDVVEADLLEMFAEYDLAEMAHDRWNITQLITHLKDRLGEERVIDFPQSFSGMSSPSKELEKLVASGRIRHGGNPVLRWMASNVAIKHGSDEQIKPDRESSREKIDGMVALIMALARATVASDDGPEQDYTVEYVG